MARSKEETKAAKAEYSRKYRASKKGKKKTAQYNKRTVKQRAARNKARRKMGSPKGKDVHHKDGNPMNNGKGNLSTRRSHHEGGAKGNKNAKKG